MPKHIIAKTCACCKETKPIHQFGKYTASKDGFHYTCKKCRKAAYAKHAKTDKFKATQKRYRQSSKGKEYVRRQGKKNRLKYPERMSSHNRIGDLVRRGKIPPASSLTCKCGEQAQHYHHPSYNAEDREKVVPVCIHCHRNL